MPSRHRARQSIDLNSPFYLYRREIQSFPLLDKEDELNLYQAIETHLQSILKACTEVPECLQVIHEHFAQISAGELRLESLLYGFASIAPLQPKSDFNQVQQRLLELRKLQRHTQDKLTALGPKALETQASQQRLLECLSNFKWNAQVIDKLVHYLQSLTYVLSPLKQKLNKALIAFKQAKNALVASHLRLVFFIAKKYTYLGAQFLDLVQEGNIGLAQAVERFDYRWGYAFSSYASVWIKHAILNTLSKLQLAPVEEEEVLESLEDEETPTPIEVISVEELCKATQRALACLPPREANILRLRFGIGVPCSHTLEEVGEIFKVTRERIRQIEAKALKALREQKELPFLKIFLKN